MTRFSSSALVLPLIMRNLPPADPHPPLPRSLSAGQRDYGNPLCYRGLGGDNAAARAFRFVADGGGAGRIMSGYTKVISNFIK